MEQQLLEASRSKFGLNIVGLATVLLMFLFSGTPLTFDHETSFARQTLTIERTDDSGWTEIRDWQRSPKPPTTQNLTPFITPSFETYAAQTQRLGSAAKIPSAKRESNHSFAQKENAANKASNVKKVATLEYKPAGVEQEAPAPNNETAHIEQKEAEQAKQEEQQKRFEETVLTQLQQINSHTNIAVSLVDIESGATLLDFKGDKTFVSASTYKIYAATSLLKLAENNNSHEFERTGWGSINACIEDSIQYSGNDCLEAWFEMDEFSGVIATVNEAKLTGTNFESFNLRTTANDLTTFLTLLQRGELLTTENTNYLLKLMREQVWREGIPAGWGDETPVANKPGFLPDNHHDAAIIDTPDHKLALSIMTNAPDFQVTAEISGLIKNAYYKNHTDLQVQNNP